MKKSRFYRVAASLMGVSLILTPVSGFAQTATTTSLQSQIDIINQLLQQIKDLQAQIQSLKTQQQQIGAQVSGAISDLVHQLDLGATGNDVTILQALLAADSDIYPEGLITGYFGNLTVAAVKRFQKANGIEQVGRVGPKTLRALSKLLKDRPVAFEDDNNSKSERNEDGDNGKHKGRVCAIIPPGHLIAPGWLRKHDGVKPIVPECQTLPSGIQKNLDRDDDDHNGTTTPDTTAPALTVVSISSITTSGAHVTWTTNEPATSKVKYGTSTPVMNDNSLTVTSGTLVTSHNIELTGLMPGTTYYFIVSSADASGNTGAAAQQSFVTATVSDTTAPALSSIAVSNVTATSSHIVWTTNEPATSNVWYGGGTPLNVSGSPTVSTSTLVTNHDVMLTGLSASTTYYYVISSADASSNTASTTESSFTTAQ